MERPSRRRGGNESITLLQYRFGQFTQPLLGNRGSFGMAAWASRLLWRGSSWAWWLMGRAARRRSLDGGSEADYHTLVLDALQRPAGRWQGCPQARQRSGGDWLQVPGLALRRLPVPILASTFLPQSRDKPGLEHRSCYRPRPSVSLPDESGR